MKFGLFDHVDRNDQPLAQQYDDRIKFVAAAEAAGFFEYHCAEHHSTPLSTIPAPSIYMAAVARATKTIRLGPLCYLLPLYPPMRLIEEICMLDHLSHGRLDVGVGRGVSGFELRHHAIDPNVSREIFAEALEVIIKGLTNDRLTHNGKHYAFENAPMEMKPLQQPHPPIWYPSSNADGARYAAKNGYSYCALGGSKHAGTLIQAFKEAWQPNPKHPTTPYKDFKDGVPYGVSRQLIIADTDADAHKIAKPAYERWYSALTKLERDNPGGPRFTAAHAHGYEDACNAGSTVVGSPTTVRKLLEEQAAITGANYMIFSCYIGNLTLADATRTVNLFSKEVAPHLANR